MPNTTDAILKVYDLNYRRILGYLRYRLFRQDIAQDAASTVFLKYVEQFHLHCDKSQAEITGWLYGTASNVAAQYLRDAGRQREIREDLAKTRPPAVEPMSHPLDWPLLYLAIATLNRRHQELIVYRFFQELSIQQIALAMGMREVTVRVSLLRALRRLKKSLGGSFGPE